MPATKRKLPWGNPLLEKGVNSLREKEVPGRVENRKRGERQSPRERHHLLLGRRVT